MNGPKKNIQQGLTELIEEAISTLMETAVQQLVVTATLRAIRATAAYGFRGSFFVALDAGSDA